MSDCKDIVMKLIDFFITFAYNNDIERKLHMGNVVNVNFRMDEDLKKSMEKACADMGLTMTTAFTIFAKKVSREKRIPFEVSADPFYSDSNIKYLEKIARDIDSGKAKLIEHDLIEVE